MYILAYEKISQDIINACGSSAIANLLSITKKALNIIQIIGPILAIVALAVCFIKLMTNPDEKKYKAGLKNSLIALVILFLVPFVINLTMSLTDESFDLAKCWNNAENVSNLGEESNYVETTDKPRQPVEINPNLPSDITQSNNNNSSNSSGNSSSSRPNNSVNRVIFIGDSRTVGMENSVGENNDTWSSKGSMGLKWMKQEGVPNIEGSIGNGTAVIILMGVNDLYQPDNYISYINEKSSAWASKGAHTYFVSVNPTERSYNHLNSQIDSFNQKLRAGLNSNVSYLDCNSYLKSNGFSTTDGLHYTIDTYNKIYNYIKSNL